MHLLAADLEAASDGVAVDLGQTPGEIVLLSAAETDLACWAAAAHRLGGSPTLRLANLLQLSHPYSVDLYTDQVLSHAKLVIVRLLGGIGYWTYGMERLARLACPVVVLPGDGRDDPTLAAASTASPALRQHLLAAFTEGGVDNADQALRAAAASLGYPLTWGAPAPLPRAWALPRRGTGPLVPILVYRALIQAGDTAPLEALSEALAARGLTAAPLAVASLKDPAAIALLQQVAAERPALTIAATGFAVGDPAHPLATPDGPVLQVAFAQDSPASWQAGKRGLGPRDIAMHVALPEVDGRVFTRAIAFKADGVRCPLTQVVLRRLSPVPDRVEFVAELAQAWVRLGLLSVAERRVALVLANYPSRDGRIGNGVGLDVPESAAVILRAMAQAGYAIANAPADGATLMAALLAGPSNQRRSAVGGELVSAADYHAGFQRLPKAVQAAVIERWGPPEADPGWVGDGFRVPALRFGAVTVMVQPARGYGVDPLRSAHDPDLVPPHGYLAAYLWVRAQADCVVHLGKHGTAEWLPGKSVALSTTCWPEVVLGPTPQLYPFIVNDPGEGTQAKRRGAAVIIDHLTPPLTRAETYGPLKDLEQLVDEYHQATSLDARRRDWLAREITDRVARAGLGADCGIEPDDSLQQRLTKLDGFLCTVKELQIRDGLHVFGRSPTGSQATDLLVALTRIPRGQNASLLRALAADLGLALDPLTASLADPAPPVAPPLQPARLIGDVVEQLEEWAKRLVAGAPLPREWTRTATVLEEVRCHLAPALAACGPAELAALMDGLAGRFVPA
ncbi:MAG: cobaltochelatase subunit CobN, partial [Alphaproteobacteria bacterium]|nr:cobaltochelatase subunit CobN [Alphaproteobacteria bacterium]